MRPYIALIHKDPESDYGASFPDLPGCVTAGRTLDEAREMAVEALALHLEGLPRMARPCRSRRRSRRSWPTARTVTRSRC
jgi:predicted RNase H-like HicB family nuclease